MIAKASKSKTNGQPTLTPAVSCIRMSSDKQDKSPDQQRAEVAKLAAKHRCKIVQEYIDEGISGIDTRRRKGFQAMVQHVQQPSAPKVILSWDQDRFSRLDSIDSGEIIAPLRRAGVRLITVAQGEIDWNTFAGRMMFGIQQEGKNQYLVDLSRNCLRGLLERAKGGGHNSAAPYGYDKVFFDQHGKQVYRCRHGETFAKPNTWTSALEISEDARAVEIVRWLFDRIANSDASVHSLAVDLNRRGVPSPKGVYWSHVTVLKMLRNRAYAGDCVYGMTSAGKFHEVGEDGEAMPATSSSGKRRRGKVPLVVENAHPPIVDRQLFNRVQEKLDARSFKQDRSRNTPYILAGILYCGHCGCRLKGTSNKKQHSTGKKKYRYYKCAGKLENGICRAYMVSADAIEGELSRIVREDLLSEETQERLYRKILERAKSRSKSKGPAPAELRKQIAALEKQIERGAENLLLAEPEDARAAAKVLAKWRAQREALQADLKAAELPTGKDSDGTVGRALAYAAQLCERIQDMDPLVVREVFRKVFAKVTLTWERRPGETRYRLLQGFCSFTNSALPKVHRDLAPPADR